MIIYNLYQNMLQQPHLLIAGATGSGKSVLIQGLIYTALQRSPEQVQFILIDPKRVNLKKYAALPHTITHARTKAEIIAALKTADNIMENRFIRMEQENIEDYPGGDLYVIIDELMDIMTSYPKIAKQLIQKLAQVGRAGKVHVIAATQSPVREVIPTPIKCNFDSRVGLRTRSAQDSRNILGVSGLEKLPRYGQGYYMNPETFGLWNLPMIPKEEQRHMIEYWSKTPA